VNWPIYSVDIHGCNVQESIDVTVYPLYQAPSIIYDELKVDLCLSEGQKIYYASDDRSSSYYWLLNGSSVLNDVDVLSINWPDTSETYLLSVYGIDDRGCLSETGGINVEVKSCHRIYAPNSFTPNGDGINDVFRLSGVGIYESRLVIYNRWGYPVFETTDLRNVWNGDDGTGHYSENDAYNLKVYYRDNGGFKREIEGTVILIR
jgi:gliding motility-associated-like protein